MGNLISLLIITCTTCKAALLQCKLLRGRTYPAAQKGLPWAFLPAAMPVQRASALLMPRGSVGDSLGPLRESLPKGTGVRSRARRVRVLQPWGKAAVWACGCCC